MSSPHLLRFAAPPLVRISNQRARSSPTSCIAPSSRFSPSRPTLRLPLGGPGASVRHASSVPSSSPLPPGYGGAPAPLPPGYELPTTSPFESVPLDAASSSAESFTPYIGYLKEMYGLDYGWGPTSIVQWVVEHVQVYSGLPWWATFCIAAILVRVSLAKLYINAADTTARMQQLRPKMEPIQAKVKAARAAGDRMGAMAVQKEMSTINKIAGVKVRRAFAPLVVQGMLGYGTFRLTRKMAEVNVAGLSDGGLLSFSDLTIPDPYYVMPLLGGFISYQMAVLLRSQQVPSPDAVTVALQPFLQYIMPVFFAGFLTFQPAATQIPMLVAVMLQYPQTLLLGNKEWRQKLGIVLLAHQLDEKPPDAKEVQSRIAVLPAAKPEPVPVPEPEPTPEPIVVEQVTEPVEEEEKNWVKTQLAKPAAALSKSLARPAAALTKSLEGPQAALRQTGKVTKAKMQEVMGTGPGKDGKKSKAALRQEKKLEEASAKRDEAEWVKRHEDRERRKEDARLELEQFRVQRREFRKQVRARAAAAAAAASSPG